jgi:tetratricopeptide (TPR) repeat protein
MVGLEEEAQRVFEEAIAFNAQDATGHYNLGNIWLSRRRLEDAEAEFQQAIRIQPDYALAHDGLAMTLAAMGKIELASTHFHKVVQLDPQNAVARFNLGRALAQIGRRKEAIAEFRKARQIGGDAPGCLERLARLLISQDEPPEDEIAEATQLAKRACELTNYADATTLATLGEAYAASGHFGEASEVTRRALAIARHSGPAQLVELLNRRLKFYQTQATPSATDENL